MTFIQSNEVLKLIDETCKKNPIMFLFNQWLVVIYNNSLL